MASFPSIVDFATVANSDDDDGIDVFDKDDAIVAHSEPASITSLQPFHIARAVSGENLDLAVIRCRTALGSLIHWRAAASVKEIGFMRLPHSAIYRN
jgi:hypothetical protein